MSEAANNPTSNVVAPAQVVARQDFPDGLRLDLNLGIASYPVFVSSKPAQLLAGYLDTLIGKKTAELADLGRHFSVSNPPRIVVLCDENTAELFGIEIETQFITAGWEIDALTLPAGETTKTLAAVEQVCEALAALGATRDTVLCSLGGGVISDLAGFIASTYKRGIPVVHIPTTLVGLIDASIGGKTAVNALSAKNMIGTYKHPLAVVSDLAFLDQLPDAEYVCGLAEAAKTAILSGEDCLAWMEDNADALMARDPNTVRELAARCIAFKARIVAEDPYESQQPSRRQALNYGHTLGHVIETIPAIRAQEQAEELAQDQVNKQEQDDGPAVNDSASASNEGALPSDVRADDEQAVDNPITVVSHGMAVAQGMRFEARLAMQLVGADGDFILRQDALLDRLGLPALDPSVMGNDMNLIDDTFYRDKKITNSELRFVLLSVPGRPELVTVPRDILYDHLQAWMGIAA